MHGERETDRERERTSVPEINAVYNFVYIWMNIQM